MRRGFRCSHISYAHGLLHIELELRGMRREASDVSDAVAGSEGDAASFPLHLPHQPLDVEPVHGVNVDLPDLEDGREVLVVVEDDEERGDSPSCLAPVLDVHVLQLRVAGVRYRPDNHGRVAGPRELPCAGATGD